MFVCLQMVHNFFRCHNTHIVLIYMRNKKLLSFLSFYKQYNYFTGNFDYFNDSNQTDNRVASKTRSFTLN